MTGFESPRFDVRGQARAALSGTLSVVTAGQLLSEGARSIGAGEAQCIDLAGVKGADSAGLALLIEWLSVAKSSGHALRYENIPTQLQQLAKLSDVEELLSGQAAA